jgi:YlmC/YmxH family sporulation protein
MGLRSGFTLPYSTIRGDAPVKISDFQSKDVINIVDGKKLGQVSDLELDLRQGRIEAIVVPNHSKFFGFFGNGTEVVIPWRNIVKIGADVVLVKLEEVRQYRHDEEEDAIDYQRPAR